MVMFGTDQEDHERDEDQSEVRVGIDDQGEGAEYRQEAPID